MKNIIRRVGWMIDTHAPIDEQLVLDTLFTFEKILDPQGCLVEPIRIISVTRTSKFIDKILKRLGRGGHHIENESLLSWEADESKRTREGPNGRSVEFLPTRVFRWNEESNIQFSHHISCYAELTHMDFLMISNSIKKKFFLELQQGFPMALGQESKVPVLILGGKIHKSHLVKRILFPVLIPKMSENGFAHLLELAQLFHAKITILYKNYGSHLMSQWSDRNAEWNMVPFYKASELVEENLNLKEISSWVSRAQKLGVMVDVHRHQTFSGYQDSIMKCLLERDYDLVAVDPNHLDSFYDMKMLKKVLKSSRCPIWITRPIGQSECEVQLEEIQDRLAHL